MWFKIRHAQLSRLGFEVVNMEYSPMGTKVLVTMERRTDGTMAEILCKVKRNGQPGRIVDAMVLDYIPD